MLHSPIERPRFANADAIVRRGLLQVRVPEPISVSVAANRHRVLSNAGGYSGLWSESPMPMRHLDRPMDLLASTSPYSVVAIMGPSQCGKSEVGNNWSLHSVIYDPADLMTFLPTKKLAERYVLTQIDPMITACEDLQRRQLATRSADRIDLKQFLGCDLHFLGAAGSNFRAIPSARARLDDFDEFPLDIDGQGDAVSLAKGRQSSLEAYGSTKLYVNSSPALGPRRGIEAIVARGTDEHLWVDCLCCGVPFELAWETLIFDATGDEELAARTACVACPDCGGVHGLQDKRRLLETQRWVGRGEFAEKGAKGGALVETDIASFRFEGLFGMARWDSLARGARAAEITFETSQDEGPLKSFFQTKVGRNYESKASGEPPIGVDKLIERARASGYGLREVPPGVQVLIATVDVQANRFAVLVTGYGVGFETWIIDRYDILTLEDEHRTPVAPFARAEHWDVLHARVMARTYPMQAEPTLRMKIFNTAVDTGGGDDTTNNAFAWLHTMMRGDVKTGRRPLPPTAMTLLKGGNKPHGPLLPTPKIDARRQVKGAQQAELFVPNVNRLKDMIDMRLRRQVAGPGFVHLPREFGEEGSSYIAEMRAEEKDGDFWVKLPHAANETGDLLAYSMVPVLRLLGLDPSLANVPEWARPPKSTPAPRTATADDRAAAEEPRVQRSTRPLPRRRGGVRIRKVS